MHIERDMLNVLRLETVFFSGYRAATIILLGCSRRRIASYFLSNFLMHAIEDVFKGGKDESFVPVEEVGDGVTTAMASVQGCAVAASDLRIAPLHSFLGGVFTGFDLESFVPKREVSIAQKQLFAVLDVQLRILDLSVVTEFENLHFHALQQLHMVQDVRVGYGVDIIEFLASKQIEKHIIVSLAHLLDCIMLMGKRWVKPSVS
jgi:hypothetical protein